MDQQYQTEHEIREGCKNNCDICHNALNPFHYHYGTFFALDFLAPTQFPQIHLLFYFLSEAENLSLLAPSSRLRPRRHRSKRKRRLLHLSTISAVISLNIKLQTGQNTFLFEIPTEAVCTCVGSEDLFDVVPSMPALKRRHLFEHLSPKAQSC